MPNAGEILFGKSAKTRIDDKSTQTPEQTALFTESFIPRVTEPTRVFGGQVAAPQTRAENISLAALEEQSKRIGTGQANLDNIGALTNLLKAASSGRESKQLGEFSGLKTDAPKPQDLISLFLANQQGGVSKEAADTLRSLMGRRSTDIDESFRTQVQDPMLKNFERDILPAISREFAGQGFRGSDRAKADARAKEDLLSQLTQQRSKFAMDAEENNLNRILQSALGLGELEGANVRGKNTIIADLISQAVGAETNRGGIQAEREANIGNLNLGGEELDINSLLGASKNLTSIDQIKEGQITDVLSQLFKAGSDTRSAEQRGLDASRGIFDTSEENELRRLQLMLQALGIPMKENIATVTPGSKGFLQGISEGFGSAVGSKLF